MSSIRSPLLVLFALLSSLAWACASAHGTFAPLAADHPANPAAPELPIEDPSAVLRATDAGATAESAHADAPAAVEYVCPMHADVVSERPGRCPKCGTELVPRASSNTESSNTEQEGHPHVH